jgi:hypothetical protein
LYIKSENQVQGILFLKPRSGARMIAEFECRIRFAIILFSRVVRRDRERDGQCLAELARRRMFPSLMTFRRVGRRRHGAWAFGEGGLPVPDFHRPDGPDAGYALTSVPDP